MIEGIPGKWRSWTAGIKNKLFPHENNRKVSLNFRAHDYTADDSFIESDYRYEGGTLSGWNIFRNDALYLNLGPGYKLLKTISCGVCSTDLARRFLPFPLPQVIGHEVVAEDMETGTQYVVEINDTPWARNETGPEPFARAGLHTHTPGRMVLGIDRLPGGFGPYILAPVNSLVEFSGLSPEIAVLVEPFAAALQAVHASPPRAGDEVAILGTGRLGSLLIAALRLFRDDSGIDFKITALARREKKLDLAIRMGADAAIDLRNIAVESIKEKYAIVYDTSGSVEGFELALTLASREVHLKSTNGQEVAGVKNMTALVVDELSIMPLPAEWNGTGKKSVFIPAGLPVPPLPAGFEIYQSTFTDAEKILAGEDFHHNLPRFDFGIAGSIAEIDTMIRPDHNHENSLIRPQGTIFFTGDSAGNLLLEFIRSGRILKTSRCGDFRKAVELLKKNREFAGRVAEHLVSAVCSSVTEAFAAARDSNNTKVIVRHESIKGKKID